MLNFPCFLGLGTEDADPEVISGVAKVVSCSNDQYSFNCNIKCHVAS